MIIGIDHGNAQIKTRNTCFVSGVEEFPTKPPMAADVIQYQSRYWTLVGKRLPVMRDKTKDDRFYLLTLFAISKRHCFVHLLNFPVWNMRYLLLLH